MANHITVFCSDPLTSYLSQPNLPPEFLDLLLSRRVQCIENYMYHIHPSNMTKSHFKTLQQHGYDQWWKCFDLIRFMYYEIKPIQKDIIEYVFEKGGKIVLDRLLSYFATDEYKELCRYLIANFRSILEGLNQQGDLGATLLTPTSLSELNRAGFIIYIRALSNIKMADSAHPEYYRLDPGLAEKVTGYFTMSDKWRHHCFKVFDVNRIWHSTVLRVVIGKQIQTVGSYPIEYLCCFEASIQNLIWLKTRCPPVNTLHRIIETCRGGGYSHQLPSMIKLCQQSGFNLDRMIDGKRPIDLCLLYGLYESVELLLKLGVKMYDGVVLKYMANFSDEIQCQLLREVRDKPINLLHQIIDSCSNQNIDERLSTTIKLISTYNYPLDDLRYGETPLSRCLYKKYQKSVKMLVQLGASIYTIINQHCYLGDFYEEYNWIEELDNLASLDVYFGQEKLLYLILRHSQSKALELIKKHNYGSKKFFVNYCVKYPDICLVMMPNITENNLLIEVCTMLAKEFSGDCENVLKMFRFLLSAKSDQINQKPGGRYPIDIILTKKTKNILPLALALLPYHPTHRPLISPKNIGNKFVKHTIELYSTSRVFWSPETHKYFPPAFHTAVFQLCLIKNRFKGKYYQVPKVILHYIITLLEKAYLPI